MRAIWMAGTFALTLGGSQLALAQGGQSRSATEGVRYAQYVEDDGNPAIRFSHDDFFRYRRAVCRPKERVTFYLSTSYPETDQSSYISKHEYRHHNYGDPYIGYQLDRGDFHDVKHEATYGTGEPGMRFLTPKAECEDAAICKPIADLKAAKSMTFYFINLKDSSWSSRSGGREVTTYYYHYKRLTIDLRAPEMRAFLKKCGL